jgi:hypothetical protein
MDGSATAFALLAAVGSGVLALVFARSTAHKLSEFAYFSAMLAEYRLLPRAMSHAAAVALTASEALVVMLLLFPTTRVAGASIAATLLGLYAIAMALNLQRGRTRIDCGCGGPGQAISWFLVVRNLVLIAIGTFVAMRTATLSMSTGGAFATIFASVLVSWLLLLVADQVIGNQTHADATSYSSRGG